MAISEKQKTFIKDFASKCGAICPSYGLKAIRAIVAQAVIESTYGASTLSSKYHNYYGMKCGNKYKGKSVNMKTKEEYKVGTKTTIKDNFRAYDSVEAGIKGYCEFITSNKRYSNLIGVTNDTEYIKRIKADGWATDSEYIAKLNNALKIVNSVLEEPAKATVKITPAKNPASDHVKKAQNALNIYINAELAVDGSIGALTRKATVKALKYSLNRDYGLTLALDGVIGTSTINAIKGKSVKKGKKSFLVTWVEITLMLLGYYTSTIEIAGVFGAGLDESVRKFQTDNGLKVDGSVGQNTINKILNNLSII